MTTNVRDVPIDPDLARRLRGAADKVASWTDVRDELIRQALSEGASSREVAELVGLSHTHVLRIARRG